MVTKHRLLSPDKISSELVLDKLFSWNSDISDISDGVLLQVSDLCTNNQEYWEKRSQYVKAALPWKYLEEDNLIEAVSRLYVFWITWLEVGASITLEELTIDIKKGNYSLVEELLLHKMGIFIENNQELEIIQTIFDLSELIHWIIEMLWILYANPQKKINITKAVSNLEIFYEKFKNNLKKTKINLEDEGLNNTLKQISATITYAQLIYGSEISLYWKDAQIDITKEYKKKKKYFGKFQELLQENEGIKFQNNWEYFIDPWHIENYNKQLTFLKTRLDLQYNLYQQEQYIEKASNQEDTQVDIMGLKVENKDLLETLFDEYDRLTEGAWEFNGADLNNNESIESKKIEKNVLKEGAIIDWRMRIQKIFDNFIIQLSNNNPDTILLFNIIELLLCNIDYIEEEMLNSFQGAINDALLSNKRFTSGDLSILTPVLKNTFRYKALYIQKQKESKIDPLTWLNNRGAFDSDFPKLLSKSTRLPETYHGVLILDIDFFKSINDNYGHAWGDVILWLLAKVVSDNIRPWTDSIYRVWWEEFAILFEVKDEDWALKFTDKIRKKISEEVIKWVEWPDIPSWVKNRLKDLNEFTVSIWYTQIISDKINMSDEEIEELLTELYQQADLALYDSKKNGRNKSTKYTKSLDK